MMTPENKLKAVEIAKDVLNQISTGTIDIKTGRYFNFNFYDKERPEDFLDFSSVLRHSQDDKKTDKSCSVCALGALFYSQVLLYNDFHGKFGLERIADYSTKIDGFFIIGIKVSIYSETLTTKLLEVFDEQMLQGIESYFEQWYVKEFDIKFDNPTDRIKKICENIIENGGDFTL